MLCISLNEQVQRGQSRATPVQTEEGTSRSRELIFIVIASIIAIQIHWSVLGIVVWYILLKRLEAQGILDQWDATRVLGVILMVRTNRGQKVLDTISKPRKAWRVFGEIGLWTCRLISAFVLIFFVLAFIGTIMNPTEIESASPSEIILIPGVSPTIPLVWGLIGLIIALVIHEYGHGILTRAHGMRVRSFGLLILGLIPIGAFAEPEGREILRAPRRERQRVFAAGPAINIYGGFIFFIAMALVANTLGPAINGVHAEGIIDQQPASEAGLQPWEVITHANGTIMNDKDDFTSFLDSHQAGDNITLTVLTIADSQGERQQRDINLTLADQYQYQLDLGTDPQILAAYGIEEGDAFLGVMGLASNDAGANSLAGPLSSSASKDPIPLVVGLAVQPFSLIFNPIDNKGEIMHEQELQLLDSNTFLGLEGTMILLHLLFWITWMNVLLGFANLIPILPFDGGHLLRDRLHDYFAFFAKFSSNTHPISVRNAAHKVSSMSSLILMGMLILIIFIPMII
uniref:Peptidase M50 n=1 Tax=uncultured marine group II/III euryarchaeote KM3_189_C01 TaxID=1457954 RepID=A0A075GQB6_9EURY|nr:peptidase M50 [uncultured marine group II/III euryarchaeote KM3_189_C01]